MRGGAGTLYLTDLDGTLLDNRACVSPVTRDLLNQMLDQGLLFSVATARSAASAVEKLAGLRLTLPIAMMNGVLIFDTASRTYVHHTAIPPETAAQVMEAMAAFEQTAYVFTYHANQLYANYTRLSTPFQRQFCLERRDSGLKQFVQAPSFSSLLGRQDVIFFSITGTREELEPLRDRVARTTLGLHVMLYEDFVNRIWYLEIFSAQAGKAAALAYLKEYCGAREVVCFGDNYNDLDMMAAADRSCAVSNGVAEACSAATAVIGSNCEDAVARFIREDWRRPAP